MRNLKQSHGEVLQALKAPASAARWDQTTEGNPTNAWTEGQISPDVARAIAAYMDANCLPAALTAAQRIDLSGVRRLLDVGAGSGCFSIAFAQANESLHCTLMDLQPMCDVAMGYASAAGVADRIDGRAVDMFRQQWPRGYDAMFFSNIFHDWDFETCAMLASKAYEALPSGGQILLHEMLLDDTHDGPPTAAAFSFYMLLSTKGQQFTASELAKLLTDAGFAGVRVTPSHGYYSVVAARKP
jgi:acetylserotonin N-methyltransferase